MITAVIFDVFETLVTHYGCPLYFGAQMAEDAGLTVGQFYPLWHGSEADRTCGRATLEEVLERILRENGVYTKELFERMIRRRVETKRLCFDRLHPSLLPTLDALSSRGVQLGLISNCYSEEVGVIRESSIAARMDALMLSFEQGIRKPDAGIFLRCAEALGVAPPDCLYVGDGGSDELNAAASVGMTALQAGWYLAASGQLAEKRDPAFPLLLHPEELLPWVETGAPGRVPRGN